MDERPLDHGDEIVRFGPLDRTSQIQLVRAEHQAFRRDREPADTIGLPHIQDDLFVHHQFIVQGQVIAVRIQMPFIERIDHDIPAQLLANSSPERIMERCTLLVVSEQFEELRD